MENDGYLIISHILGFRVSLIYPSWQSFLTLDDYCKRFLLLKLNLKLKTDWYPQLWSSYKIACMALIPEYCAVLGRSLAPVIHLSLVSRWQSGRTPALAKYSQCSVWTLLKWKSVCKCATWHYYPSFLAAFSKLLTATWGLKCSGIVCKCSKEVKVMKLDLYFHRHSSWHGEMESWNQGWMVSTKQPRQVSVMPGY